MDIGLITLREDDIAKHMPVAQSLVTRFVQITTGSHKSKTEIAGTRRRFVSTVSSVGSKSTNEVEFEKTVSALRPDDRMLSIAQHGLVYKTRRAIAVAMAIGDLFGEQTGLDALIKKNAAGSL